METPQESTSTSASLRRIAIVMNCMPTSIAADMLQAIDADSRRRVLLARENLTDVTPSEREAALRKFSDQMEDDKHGPVKAPQNSSEFQDEFEIGTDTPLKSAGASIVNPQVAAVVSQWELPRTLGDERSADNRFAFLDNVDDDTVVQLLASEHAQTIALVFTSITPKQAARVLPRLDLSVQEETIRRIGRLDNVPDATADEVANLLRDRAVEIKEANNTSGKLALQAIMDAMPDDFENSTEWQDSLDTNKPDPNAVVNSRPINDPIAPPTLPFTAPLIPDSLSTDEVHQHLLSLSPRQLCDALGRVKTREALLTLCGLPSELAEKTLALLPRGKAKQVRRGMAKLGSLQIREIDEAKAAVAAASTPIESVAA